MKPRRHGRLSWLCLILMLAGIGLLGRDGYMQAKSAVAAVLVNGALAAHLRDGRPHRPWRWADFMPSARLVVPGLDLSLPVLDGAAGQTMAFGLYRLDAYARPSADAHVVLAGHRDSWGSFMGDLQPGDVLELEFAGGRCTYRVIGAQVVKRTHTACLARGDGAALSLVTCYPVDGVVPTDERLVVSAVGVTEK